ncbi:30S ribosomal protein S16 [Nocardioides pantholopis]|uniref:30S ribosomal protein S16 n=1 Tax=Nocardioides pantholopis TaxID=2483798 RepID=UPI000F08334B|nr:30S ribosomal protein S16 [Nocardioides pantholopis]
MAVKIRLKRLGKIRVPQYRIVVVDSRKKRDGKVLEEIGKYHPKEDPSYIDVTSERAQYWLGVGAQPTEAVEAILKVTGDWQKFKGLPGAEGTLRHAEAKRDKLEAFNEALKDAHSELKGAAVTKKAAAKKSDKADKAEKSEQADKSGEAEVTAGKSPEAAVVEAEAAETGNPKATSEPAADAEKPADETEA